MLCVGNLDCWLWVRSFKSEGPSKVRFCCHCFVISTLCFNYQQLLPDLATCDVLKKILRDRFTLHYIYITSQSKDLKSEIPWHLVVFLFLTLVVLKWSVIASTVQARMLLCFQKLCVQNQLVVVKCHMRQLYSKVLSFPRAIEIQIHIWIKCLLK